MAYITTTSEGDYNAQLENVWSPDDSGAYIGDFNGSKPHTIQGGSSARRIISGFCKGHVIF